MPPLRFSLRHLSVWTGFLLGSLLAVLGTYIEVASRGGGSLDTWIVVQVETPYLWALDVLPIVFAVLAYSAGQRTKAPQGRSLGLLAAGLILFSITAFGYALDQERKTGEHLSDVNASGSLRYRSLYVPLLAQEGRPWERELDAFETVLRRLALRYPAPGVGVEAAWEPYARGLRESGTVEFDTVEELRLAANEMTVRIEEQGLIHSDHATFGFVFGLLGMMAFLVMGVALLSRIGWMQRRLSKSEMQFRSTLANAPIGMAIVSLEGRFVSVNRALCEMLGYEEEALLASDFQTITHPEDLNADLHNVLDLIEGRATMYRMEKRYFHARGETVWAQLDVSIIRDDEGQPVHFISQIQDITKSRASQLQLQYLATHDALTGLVKRGVLAERLQHAIDLRAKTPSHSYAVLFIDLDSFKEVNDTYGHAIGDELLEALAERIQACVRETDVVARVGGDEFAVLLNGMMHEASAREMAERIQSALASPFRLSGGLNLQAGASIGIAIGKEAYQSYEDILHDADHAMYASKARQKGGIALHTGQDAYIVPSVEMDRTTEAGAAPFPAADLSRAIENDELELRYQPIVRLSDGHLAGFEALVRWHHPQRGLLAPSVFIPLAESSGLIAPLGEWVCERASRQALEWEDAYGPLAVNVNVSRHQLEEPERVERLLRVLQQGGDVQVVLELTEATEPHDIAAIREGVRRLADAGSRVFLDDFGTGYSFLNDVIGMPLAGLKMDRSLIWEMGRENGSETVLKAMAEMAARMDMETVAEGIEDEEHLRRVRALGCTYGQGYLFAPPVTAPEATALIAATTWARYWENQRSPPDRVGV